MAAFVGQPKPVSSGGATATVTLNGVRYAPSPDADSDGELAILDLTITGTSPAPFTFGEDQFSFVYSDPGSPYTDEQDTNSYGVRPDEDYTPFVPPQPLRVGQVTAGQSKRGLIILEGSTHIPYLVEFTGSDLVTTLAEWALTSK